MQRQLADRDTFNTIWQQLLEQRTQVAKNAGMPDFRAYNWKKYHRFDYTPADCESFHRAIEEVVVPIMQRLYAKRKAALGVESLRPWDTDVDIKGRDPIKPYQKIDELVSKMSRIFHRVDPHLGGYFDAMRENDLLDMDNRKGKAPGGYCIGFPIKHEPFIFMNAVGMHDDVQTLLHEGGHAFHVYETQHLPYIQQKEPPIEFAEVASMSMELIGAPYLTASEGGYYTPEDAARARIEKLSEMLWFWTYMSVVDAFQHHVYTNADKAADPAYCDTVWSELWDRFMSGVDYTGLEDIKMTGWHRKLHIFTVPLYYVEYGLAQLGSVQVWAKSLDDQKTAVANYRQALSLGCTASLPDLFAAAGAKFAFDAGTLRRAVDLIEKTINDLEAVERQ